MTGLALPDVSKIGPYRYQTEYLSEPFKPLDDPKGEDLIGESCHLAHKIRVMQSEPRRMFVIYMHEILHALDDMVEAGLTEKQVSRLSPALVSFLLDNGFLQEESA